MKKAPEEVAVVPFGHFISSYITRSLADVNHAPALVDKLRMHDALKGKRLLADLALYGVSGNLLHAATVDCVARFSLYALRDLTYKKGPWADARVGVGG